MLNGSLNLGRETRGLIAHWSVNQIILGLFLWLVGRRRERKDGNKTRDNYFWKHCQSACSNRCGWRINVLMEPVGYLNECEEEDGQNISFLHKLCDGDHSRSSRVVDHLLLWLELGSCNFGRKQVIDELVLSKRHLLLFSHWCNLGLRWGKTMLLESKY